MDNFDIEYFINEIFLKDHSSFCIHEYFKNIPNSEDIVKCLKLILDFSKCSHNENHNENLIKIICLIQDIVNEVQSHSNKSENLLLFYFYLSPTNCY